MKAVIYARVSKEAEGEQNPNNQIEPLKKWAAALNLPIQEIFIDRASGGDSNRPEFKRMMGMASQHRFDTVLVWALDRFSRESLHNTLAYIERLRQAKVGLRSYQEQWMNTTEEGGIGDVIIAVFAWAAQFERKRISDRTKAALQRRRNLGLPMGRPRKIHQ